MFNLRLILLPTCVTAQVRWIGKTKPKKQMIKNRLTHAQNAKEKTCDVQIHFRLDYSIRKNSYRMNADSVMQVAYQSRRTTNKILRSYELDSKEKSSSNDNNRTTNNEINITYSRIGIIAHIQRAICAVQAKFHAYFHRYLMPQLGFGFEI